MFFKNFCSNFFTTVCGQTVLYYGVAFCLSHNFIVNLKSLKRFAAFFGFFFHAH